MLYTHHHSLIVAYVCMLSTMTSLCVPLSNVTSVLANTATGQTTTMATANSHAIISPLMTGLTDGRLFAVEVMDASTSDIKLFTMKGLLKLTHTSNLTPKMSTLMHWPHFIYVGKITSTLKRIWFLQDSAGTYGRTERPQPQGAVKNVRSVSVPSSVYAIYDDQTNIAKVDITTSVVVLGVNKPVSARIIPNCYMVLNGEGSVSPGPSFTSLPVYLITDHI